MGLGDEMMAAGHAQRVYDADPSRRVAICDAADRPRWHELWRGNPIIAPPEAVAAGERVHRIRNASGCRPYIAYPFTHDTGLRCTRWRAADHPSRLYLTEDERAPGVALRARLGRFVVIEPGLKATSSPNKAWSTERYAAVVGACPDVPFVRLAHADSTALPGALTVEAPTFRHACGILAAAAAYVGPEGGLHHAAAALGVRAVVLFGGFISPTVTGYPSHVNLADEGPGSPCGRWRPCAHCRAAMDRITVDRVVEGLRTVLNCAAQPVREAVA